MTTAGDEVRPGWYPDPAGRFELRYHNGVAWTGDVAVAGQRYVDPAGALGGPPREQPRNGIATAALTCGVVSVSIGWLPVVFVGGAVLAVLAVVLGAVGVRRARTTGAGRRFAVTGLVTGALGAVASVGGGALTVLTYRAVERYEDPAAHTVAIDTCDVADGEAVVAGTLRNDSDGPADFTVSIEVRRAGSRAAIGTVRIPLTDVAPGETRRFEFGDEVRPASIECDLVEVTGPAPFGLPAG